MKRGLRKFESALISGCAVLSLLASPAMAQDRLPIDHSNLPDRPDFLDVGQPVTSLDVALDRAYLTNPALLAERARLESIDFRLPQARARSGLQLNYEVGYGYRRDNIEQQVGGSLPRAGWAPSASAVLTQPLFTFGRNAAGERTASAQIDYQRAALRAMEQQVLLQTVSAYVTVLREREAVRIAAENLALLERELADNSFRLQARDTTRTDVDQVATRVELGKAQLLQAHRAVAFSEAEFLNVIGSPPGDLSPPGAPPLPARSLEDAYTVAQQRHPILVAAYARERASRAQVSIARAERMPRVDLRGRAGVDTNLFGLDRLQQTSLRGEFVVSGPIFQSGALNARLGEAEAANDADWRLIDQTLRETRAEVSDAWNEWLTAEGSLGNLANAVILAEQAHSGAVLQERVGMRTTLDVLDLARDLLSAKISHNQARATLHIAKVRVLAAIGMLELADLVPGRPQLVDVRHYNRVSNDGDTPLITSVIQSIDRMPLGSQQDREIRDPSAALLTPAVPIATPTE